VLALPRAEDAKGDARVKMQYHTAAEALEAATSALAAKDARIAELVALAAVRGALESLLHRVRPDSEAVPWVLSELRAIFALTATPPRRTPDATEWEGGSNLQAETR
jgi:hypothetical protein